MGSKSNIEWCDATWTPIRARRFDDRKVGVHCERVSPGCLNCYSSTFNRRRLPNQGTGLDFVRGSRDKVEIFLDGKLLSDPMRWRKPKRIFVCSQTDLFAEFVPFDFIDRVFAVMALCPQHTFQILTKRPERMREYVESFGWDFARLEDIACQLSNSPCAAGLIEDVDFPLKNVWLGVSVENQDTLHRIDTLKDIPAAVRFVSFEPLLEDLGAVILDKIHWAIIGGESGPGARPMFLEWAQSLIQQCRDQSVAPFMKQFGANVHELSGETWWPEGAALTDDNFGGFHIHLEDRKGGSMDEWPEDLRVREFPKQEVLV